eukprot:2729919-Pyramimonas_sp.AAC.1
MGWLDHLEALVAEEAKRREVDDADRFKPPLQRRGRLGGWSTFSGSAEKRQHVADTHAYDVVTKLSRQEAVGPYAQWGI